MQVAWLIVPRHHFAMHGLLIARECIYCAMSPWYLDGETIGWALFLLVRGIIMCFVHGQRNSGVLHHGDDSGFAPIPSDTDQMCVVFPCLGADWQSVKTGTSLEWVNFADGEWMSLKVLWMNFIHAPLYGQNIFYHSMWKWKLAGTSMAFKFCWVDKKIDEISYSLFLSLSLNII